MRSVSSCASGDAASYLSIDSSRSSDGRGPWVSEAQCGVREAERAAICGTTFELTSSSSSTRASRTRAVIASIWGALSIALEALREGIERELAGYTGLTLDVFARGARFLDCASRRAIFSATRCMAPARSS